MKKTLLAMMLILIGGCSSHFPKEHKGVEKEPMTSQMKKQQLRTQIFSLNSQINNLNAMKTSAQARLLHHQNSGAANIESGSLHINNFSWPLPGWVSVDFGLVNKNIDESRGIFSENYDAFVGALLDIGLNPNLSNWIKPTFGNSNILWTKDSQLGHQYANLLWDDKQAFSADSYSFHKNEIVIEGVVWNYTYFKQSLNLSAGENYWAGVFFCKGNPGVSVFYWGIGPDVDLKTTDDVRQSLALFDKFC